jgi:hypothetical protein
MIAPFRCKTASRTLKILNSASFVRYRTDGGIDVAVFAQEASAAAQVRHLIDRCVRVAKAVNGPSVLILPKDVQDADYEEPAVAIFKGVLHAESASFPNEMGECHGRRKAG